MSLLVDDAMTSGAGVRGASEGSTASRPPEAGPRDGWRRRVARYRPGLRLKLNLVVLPLLAITIGFFTWLDYRHEVAAVMEAHALHAGPASGGAAAGPVAPATSPDAVGRRALVIHGAFAGAVLALVVLAVNWSVSLLVLRPIDRIRHRVARMTRGDWRVTTGREGDDELGRLAADFDRLGLAVDALAGQLLHAERLATIALVSKRLESSLGPEVQRIVAALGRLQRSGTDADGECRVMMEAATRLVAVLRGLDRCFDGSSLVRR
jgi:HAMP domain-containing protein